MHCYNDAHQLSEESQFFWSLRILLVMIQVVLQFQSQCIIIISHYLQYLQGSNIISCRHMTHDTQHMWCFILKFSSSKKRRLNSKHLYTMYADSVHIHVNSLDCRYIESCVTLIEQSPTWSGVSDATWWLADHESILGVKWLTMARMFTRLATSRFAVSLCTPSSSTCLTAGTERTHVVKKLGVTYVYMLTKWVEILKHIVHSYKLIV